MYGGQLTVHYSPSAWIIPPGVNGSRKRKTRSSPIQNTNFHPTKICILADTARPEKAGQDEITLCCPWLHVLPCWPLAVILEV